MWQTRLERLTEQLDNERRRVERERLDMRNAARKWSAWRSLTKIEPKVCIGVDMGRPGGDMSATAALKRWSDDHCHA